MIFARLAMFLLFMPSASPLPNIVIVLADDLGFGGVSWAPAGDLLTPALDVLRQESVLLSSYYAYKYCSPSRASLLTGRFPYKTESTRNNLIPYSQEEGVNLNFTFLPQRLKDAGYATHGVGKWHQGLWSLPFTPTRRGFDSFRGYLAGGQDHFTQDSFGECGCAQKDMWGDGAVNATGENTYNAFRFTARAVEVIEATAAAGAPLFLYVALQNVHAPIEADPSFSRLYPNIKYDLRRNWNAMVSTMDSSVGNITAALKKAGMWENTVLWWASDNGSPVQVGGTNFPLRGSKGSNWEGGVRVPAMVGGGLVPPAQRGTARGGLVHVSDIYATALALAGLPPADGAWAPVDGLNVWPYVSGAAPASPRALIVHEHNLFDGPPSHGALRSGDLKLVIQAEPSADWYGVSSAGNFCPPESGTQKFPTQCSIENPCMFNVTADPEERVDLAASRPADVAALTALFRSFDAEHHPPAAAPKRSNAACCNASAANGGFLAPWG